jgi:thioredoxin 1
MAFELTSENFEETLEKNKVALVDFWASWCGPCQMMGPIVEELAKMYDGKALVGKVNVDKEGDIAVKYNVRSIPMFVVFKHGEPAETVIGAVPKERLAQLIEKHLK